MKTAFRFRNVSDGVVSGVGRKWKRSDSSDSDSVALMTPLTTPIFDFHLVISALTTPLTTLTPSLVKTSLKKLQERMKVREVIPQIGPIPIVIPLKLFLEGIDFLADNVTSRVTCLSPFLILQRLIIIIHFHKRKCFTRYLQRMS